MPLVDERVSARVTGVFTKDDGNPLPVSAMNTLTMTLYNKEDGIIINSRDHVDIFNTGGGSVDVNGNFSLELTSDDNVVLDVNKMGSELHILLLEWMYQASMKSGKQEVIIAVKNLNKVS